MAKVLSIAKHTAIITYAGRRLFCALHGTRAWPVLSRCAAYLGEGWYKPARRFQDATIPNVKAKRVQVDSQRVWSIQEIVSMSHLPVSEAAA